MIAATHSLTEVANQMRLDMKDPERFLRGRIKAGVIPGRKIGRSYRMTDDDVTAALEVFRTGLKPVEPEADTYPIGLTQAALRRRAS